MKNRKGLVAVLVALIAVSAGGWWALRTAAPASATRTPAPLAAKPEAIQPATPASLDTIPQPAPVASLPPVDAPLGYVIDDLKRRAAAGEAAAGCRLASEYAFCARLKHRHAEQQLWLTDRRRALDLIGDAQVRKGAAADMDRELAFRDEQLGKVKAHCKDVPVPDARQLARLWRSAALAGDPAAMRQYASGNAFQWGELLDVLPELATYRKEGEHIALVAARRGDFDMLLALASAYGGTDLQSRSLLNQAVRPDRAMSLAIYRHIEATLVRNGNEDEAITQDVRERIADLRTDLDGAGLARADKLAADVARDWAPPVVRGVDRLRTAGSLREVDRRWCGR